MKKLIAAVVLLAALYAMRQFAGPEAAPAPAPEARHAETRTADALADAISERRSGVQVTGEGRVARVLADDDHGSRHQRFILELDSGDTLLVAHNIDLAPRVDALRDGDVVEFNGEYEWNAKGGVIHWTHHDPAGRHVDGWLRHEGRTYR